MNMLKLGLSACCLQTLFFEIYKKARFSLHIDDLNAYPYIDIESVLSSLPAILENQISWKYL